MPYAEKIGGDYKHEPFPVPGKLLKNTRYLYRLNRSDPLTYANFTALTRAAQLATRGTDGSLDAWSQILRLSCLDLIDKREFTQNVAIFRNLVQTLVTREVGNLTLLDAQIQLTCIEEDDRLASGILEHAILPRSSEELFPNEHMNQIKLNLSDYGYDDTAIHISRDDTAWKVYTFERSFDASVKSLATATVHHYLAQLR